MGRLSFYEIQPNMGMSLVAENQNGSVELPLKLANLSDAEKLEVERRVKLPHVVLDVLMSEWKQKLMIISFQDTKARLSMIVVDNATIYKFDPVYVTLLELKSGKKVHMLVSKFEYGHKHNRRHGIRIGMNTESVVYQDKERYSVYVNDVSYCGVGLIEDEDSLLDEKLPIVVWVTDPSSGRQIAKVPCKIVRRNKLDNGRYITGCMIENKYHAIMQKYVATRQMERVKRYAAIEGVKHFEDHGEWKESIVYQFQQEKKNAAKQNNENNNTKKS